MRKFLLKIIIVWCLKTASAAPIKGHDSRAARQWVLYDDSVPYGSIYPDQQEPLPYLYPYYNTPELNLQFTGLYPYNQVTYYNQPLHYLPNVLPEKLKPAVQIIDKGSKISSILKSKLKIAQNLFGMFGIKAQKKQNLKPYVGAEANVVGDYNTVSILPERLGCFLAKLKEEILERSEGIPEQKAEGQEEGTLDSIKSNAEVDKNAITSNNVLFSSQQVRSNDDTMEEITYEKSEKMTEEIKSLSNDEIRDLIRFFDTVREIYDKSDPHSLTDTIVIKMMSGQPKDLTDSLNKDNQNGDVKSNSAKIDCDVNSSEKLDDDKISVKSSKCELVMSVTVTHQTTENIQSIVESSGATESSLELKDYISKEDSQNQDITSESERNFTEPSVIEEEIDSASVEAPKEIVVTPRNIFSFSVLNKSINESTTKLNGSTTTSTEDNSMEDNYTNRPTEEYKYDDQVAAEHNQHSSATVEQEQSESPVPPLH